MKTTISLCALALFWSCFAIGQSKLTPSVLNLIPQKYNIQGAEFSDARKELEELIDLCGAGVIEGSSEVNRCSYTVKLDELFFEPQSRKTGLLHDKDWAYRDGVTFFETNLEMSVPDNFDLRDLMKNGQPEIRKQQCGDCWAWSTHHGLEIARAVHDQKVYDHSIQTVLSCSKAGSCNGGYMKAVDFLVRGLPLEPEFPYAGSDKACKFSSTNLQSGWDGKIIAAPYIGNSLSYSRANRLKDGSYRDGTKVNKMMEAMFAWNSPLVVTVASYSISGPGVYDSCSAINSGGNHMVAIVGWEMWNGKRVAHVWNSHGQGHGEKGVSRIVWECGSGKLNRGLGVSAKIVQYKTPCTPPDASQTYLHEVAAGQSVQIGAPQAAGVQCTWLPTEGLSNPNSCVTTAKPDASTEYHLTAQNACGKSSSMTLVHVWNQRTGEGEKVITPFGVASYDR